MLLWRLAAVVAAVAAASAYAGAQAPAAGSSTQAAGARMPAAVSRALIDDLVAGNRILAAMGIVDARGHISVRHPDNPQRYLISRAIAPATVTADDILEFDLDNNVIGNPRKFEVYSERFIHGEAYKARPDIKAVVHAHTPSILLFGSIDTPLRPMNGFAAFLGTDRVPFANEKGGGISNAPDGRLMAERLGQGSAVLMRWHGVVVVGFSIPNVVGRIYHLDNNAQALTQALAMGATPQYPAVNPGAALRDNPYDREWDLWKSSYLAK